MKFIVKVLFWLGILSGYYCNFMLMENLSNPLAKYGIVGMVSMGIMCFSSWYLIQKGEVSK